MHTYMYMYGLYVGIILSGFRDKLVSSFRLHNFSRAVQDFMVGSFPFGDDQASNAEAGQGKG